jgi:acetyl esterase/lipase
MTEEQILSEVPPPQLSNFDKLIEGAEAAKSALLKTLEPLPEGVTRHEQTFTTGAGAQLRAKVYRPLTPPAKGSPLIVLFHAGGFCVGVPESEEIGARNLVLEYGAVCVSFSYRLAPKYIFPTAVNDAWAALKWAVDHIQELGATPSAGFIVGGTSAGAHLATIVAHRARDEGLTPSLTGQFLAVPLVCSDDTIPKAYTQQNTSWEQNRDAPVLSVKAIELMMSAYKPDVEDGKNFSIINHPGGHGQLPRTVVVADGLDPLRDQAIIYEKILREEFDVETKLYLYSGVPHDHWSFFPSLEKSKQFRRDQVEAYGWLLEQPADH